MIRLIDPDYPFCSEAKEFRLVMRALKSGWVDGEAASDLVSQAMMRVLSNNDVRETLSLIKTAVTIDRRRLRRYWAEARTVLRQRAEETRKGRPKKS